MIKEEPGGDLRSLSNREKTMLMVALKNRYKTPALLARLGLARSSYFYHLDLSRFRAAPGARLGHLAFESDRAFLTQC